VQKEVRIEVSLSRREILSRKPASPQSHVQGCVTLQARDVFVDKWSRINLDPTANWKGCVNTLVVSPYRATVRRRD
jgi:hypothetical protein